MLQWRVKFSMADGTHREFFVEADNLDAAIVIAAAKLNGARFWATESQVVA